MIIEDKGDVMDNKTKIALFSLMLEPPQSQVK
jgi:hypothetical protein